MTLEQSLPCVGGLCQKRPQPIELSSSLTKTTGPLVGSHLPRARPVRQLARACDLGKIAQADPAQIAHGPVREIGREVGLTQRSSD
jgi:hypothetical protein